MKIRTVVLFLGALGFCSFLAGCVAWSCSSFTVNQFSSKYLSSSFGGMMSSSDRGLMLALPLTNKSNQPLWVNVSFEAPDPTQRGEVAKALGIGEQQMFTYPQTSLTYDTFYPIYVSTYADAAHTKLLERAETNLRFGAEAKQALEKASKGAEAMSKK